MEERKTAAAVTTTEIEKDDAKILNNSDKSKELEEKVQYFSENLEKLQINNIPDEQEPPSLFNINGIDVLPKCSINIVAAQKKSGKSNFAGLLMTACCSSCHSVLNGAIKSNLGALKVLNIDTEQPLKDARRTLKRVMKTAGFDYDEQWSDHGIYSISVKDLGEEDRRIVTEIAINHYQPQLVFIDGVADMVKSVNDEVENKEVMAWMDYLSCHFNCAVVGMLHLNHGTGKIGGWAGTQANKKFTDSFLLKKDKSNGFFLLEHEGRGESAPNIRFKIVCPTGHKIGWWDSVESTIPNTPEEDEKTKLRKLVAEANLPCCSSALVSWLMEKNNWSSRPTATSKLTRMVSLGILNKRKDGNKVEYFRPSTTDTQEQKLSSSYSD